MAVAGLVFFALSGTTMGANADSSGQALAPSASLSAGASVETQRHASGDDEVRALGIGQQTTVAYDTWVHHIPRVYTNPSYVFIAHRGENLAVVCSIWGELYQSSNIWYLVIDRNQDNAVGYFNQVDVLYFPIGVPDCGTSFAARALAPSSAGASADTQRHASGDGEVRTLGIGQQTTVVRNAWVHHTPRLYTTPDHVFTAYQGDNLAAVCWIVGDTYHQNDVWYLVIDRYQTNAVGYLSQVDVQGTPNVPACGQS
ncbi:hypothetical protein AB0395_34465 [Streptosporangium sp. NPDC051023]|uniref:hypothetical protein n=1 Tax=Streptosporangium sp. NPDC051023 TaxID=3155410 RepID=UPI00344E6518